MTFEELSPKLQKADKLRRLSGKFREEWEGIMKKEFWSFLVGHQYWKEFLAYESGQDLGTIEKLITLGCMHLENEKFRKMSMSGPKVGLLISFLRQVLEIKLDSKIQYGVKILNSRT